ncbi:3-deoxy-8-phosphooctulonate synthase [Mucisphaera sp.]|uniref:3-deoxy-8-phosphooctulonate synthase n=1 Tax=Mucisphaera sp. TaxID=2913024 RepID=UPI003D0A4119
MRLDGVEVGAGRPLTVISGPCMAESLELCMAVGRAMKARCEELGLSYVFKASFDKANRSSIHTPRGPGLEKGLEMLAAARAELGVPVTTDIHEPGQAEAVAGVVDLLQIPAFLCRQTDLLVAAAGTGKAVNAKKGQFMSPGEMVNVVTKLKESGAGEDKILLTERGTFFGYHRLVNDIAGFADLMELGVPVCFDATHSTQQPGGQGQASGGRPERAATLAKAAVAAGADAVFIEAHPEPSAAMSDGSSMLTVEAAVALLGVLKRVREAVAGD